MLTWIIIFGIYIILTLLGSYLAFFKFRSDAWVKRFGIWPDNKIDLSKSNDAMLSAVYSHGFRAFLLIVCSVIFIPMFSNTYGGIHWILESKIYQYSVIALLVAVIVWCVIIGPITLAKKYNEALSFREHFIPYICDIPNIAATTAGLAPLLIGSVIIGSIKDYQFIIVQVTNFLNAYPKLTAVEAWNIHLQLFNLIDFAHLLTNMSQKYITSGVLILLYAIAEQRTNVGKTITEAGVELIKVVAWVVLAIGIGLGLIILPNLYLRLYNTFGDNVSRLLPAIIKSLDQGNQMLDLQASMESHDLAWFLLEVLSGYGNLLALTVVGIIWISRKFIFKGLTFAEILKLFFPAPIFRFIENSSARIGINIHTTLK